jgi:NADPH:quinone reductase-like Zn-dependent oxidoreductase
MRKRVRKILLVLAGLVPVLGIAGALVISHDAACPAAVADATVASATRMQAITYRCYGGPEVLQFTAVDKPVPTDRQVLVRVHAAALNPLDWHYMRGKPYVMRLGTGMGAPTEPRLGVDFAGVVEAVGTQVQGFAPGDRVFGARNGALAEYVTVSQDRNLVPMPPGLSFEQAAGIPIAALTALQALRDEARLQPGQRVLINGASGGVGTFAVQIAKALGAEVTAVCSTRNLDLVRSLGADHVIDYTRDDFADGSQRYDAIIDMVGSQGLLKSRAALEPQGAFVIVGGPDGAWLGPLVQPLKALAIDPFVSQRYSMVNATLNAPDLAHLASMIAAGKLTPVVDQVFPLQRARDAVAYLEQGRARGKVIVSFAADGAGD